MNERDLELREVSKEKEEPEEEQKEREGLAAKKGSKMWHLDA